MILRDRIANLGGSEETGHDDASSSAKGATDAAATSGSGDAKAKSEASAEGEPRSEPTQAEPLPAGVGELAAFLAGESWYDETGWRGLWEREGIDSPAAWLKDTGFRVLMEQRRKLAEHPALLAGCRRRWIVVSRYAGVEVPEASELWNKSDS